MPIKRITPEEADELGSERVRRGPAGLALQQQRGVCMDPASRLPPAARATSPPAGRSSFCSWNIFGYSADTVGDYFINIV